MATDVNGRQMVIPAGSQRVATDNISNGCKVGIMASTDINRWLKMSTNVTGWQRMSTGWQMGVAIQPDYGPHLFSHIVWGLHHNGAAFWFIVKQ